jgi:hypothetical protein
MPLHALGVTGHMVAPAAAAAAHALIVSTKKVVSVHMYRSFLDISMSPIYLNQDRGVKRFFDCI